MRKAAEKAATNAIDQEKKKKKDIETYHSVRYIQIYSSLEQNQQNCHKADLAWA